MEKKLWHGAWRTSSDELTNGQLLVVDNAVTSLHGEFGGAALCHNLLARRTKLIATIIIIGFLASS